MQRVNIPEEHLLTIQNFDLDQTFMQSKIKKYKETHQINSEYLSITNNTQCAIELKSEDITHKVLTADWKLLGTYSKSETKYIWTYPWFIISDTELAAYKTQVENIFHAMDSSLHFLSKNILETQDPMLISFILSILYEELDLQYVHIHITENNYVAFGLKNIIWENQTSTS